MSFQNLVKASAGSILDLDLGLSSKKPAGRGEGGRVSFYKEAFPQLKVAVKKEHQLWLSLNQPEQSNALSLEMIASLVRVLKHADFDPQIRVIVLTGEGKNFCAGGDIKAMKERSGMFAGESNELRLRYMQGIQQIPLTMESLSTPVIGMINGAAIGAGCDLAMMCDLRTGSPRAKFGETFTKLGLVPGDGGSFFLIRALGYAKAMQMFMTGEILEGAAAKDFGLLNELHPENELVARTEELAAKIAANAPVAVQMTKRAMKLSYLHDLTSSLDLLAAFQGIAQRTEDHFEALAAFEQKRAAQFKGN